MTSFRLGQFDFDYLTVGSFEIAPGDLFATAPAAEFSQALACYNLSPEKLVFQVRTLIIDTGSNRVVIDPSGDWENPHRLETVLEQAEIDPDSIDTVIVSHGHGDHFWGGVRADGSPLFSNARYWIQRSEWQHWLSADNPEPDHAANFKQTLLPLEDRFSFADGAQEIVPGIRSRPAFGHSPGQMTVEIGAVATYTSDVLLSPPNVEHPDWSASFDVWPEQVVASRRELLDELGGSGALVLTCHMPGSGAGKIVPAENGWRWQPEELR